MAKRQKYYVVWRGIQPGIYLTWEECEHQVKGFPNPKYKAFDTEPEAMAAFADPDYPLGNHTDEPSQCNESKIDVIKAVKDGNEALIYKAVSGGLQLNALAVDAACSGNPGDMEYRGVYVRNGQQVFLQGVYHEATNNIGEFLAIVHGLALLKQKGLDKMILYSDSRTAMAWVKARKCKTKLVETEQNALVFERIRAAENWLATHSWSNEIRKWETEKWGEIPADFGRK